MQLFMIHRLSIHGLTDVGATMSVLHTLMIKSKKYKVKNINNDVS